MRCGWNPDPHPLNACGLPAWGRNRTTLCRIRSRGTERTVEDGAGPSGTRRASRPDEAGLALLYHEYGEDTRRHLHHFGVRGHDLDDLVQEVFLILHGKRGLLPHIKPFDAWLREVCRRVAAGERRRAHRRREVASGEPPDTADEALATDAALEQGEQTERLYRALGRLTEHERDLVALHELGDLPLTEVAELVDADRKTVRKRLETALRHLTQLVGSLPAPTVSAVPATPPSEPPTSTDGFRLLALHPAIKIGLIGSVLIAIWPGVASVEALEVLDEAIAHAVESCSGGFAYLAVVEAGTRPPNLAARQKIVAMLQTHAHHIRVYAAAIQGGRAWIVRPIMTGLSLLARPPFPMQYFNGVPLAARWLAEKHARLSNVSATSLIETTERLRSYE
jgi:RNA polymerase sigma-70 factor, ECF subfamily